MKRAKRAAGRNDVAENVDAQMLEVIGSISHKMAKSESAGEAFGKIVAIALDGLAPKKRMEAQLKIQQILFDFTE